MNDELKNVLQGLVQAEFSKISQLDDQMTGFLKQYGLPNVLHSLTANSDIPDAIWTKIEEFQKKGSAANFKQAIEGGE